MTVKKLTSIFMSVILMLSLFPSAYATGSEEESALFVREVTVTSDEVIVKGASKSNVTAMLIRPGHVYSDIYTSESMFDCISDMDSFKIDKDGKFTVKFFEDGINEQYSLYIANGRENVTLSCVDFFGGTRIYVSPSGNDQNDGSKSSPLKTIDAARQKARQLKSSGEKIQVVIEEGEYENQTVSFTKEDSGTSREEPISYVSYGAKFTGTKKVPASAFKKLDDYNMKSRLRASASDNVLCADLSELGFTEKDVDFLSEFVEGDMAPVIGVYVDKKRQTLARYPNEGYMLIDSVQEEGGARRWGRDKYKGAIFTQNNDNLSHWENAKNAYMAGYISSEYWAEWAKIKSVNGTEHQVELSIWTQYGVKEQHKWFITNLIEELDIPGEFYIEDMKLYLYPDEDFNEDTEIEIAVQKDPVINISGAENLEFDGFDIFGIAGYGIYTENTNNVTIKNCDISHVKENGIYGSGKNLTIDGCDVYNIYDTGIYIADGGDRMSLTSSGHVISNNHIYNTGMDSGINWNGGIQLSRTNVGTVVSNNLLHSIRNYSYSFGGNKNVFTHNEVWSGVRETGDAFVTYSGRDLSEYGNVMSYNYVHDCINNSYEQYYPTHGLGSGDDWESGIVIENNIVNPGGKKKTAAFYSHSRDNTFRYNIAVNAAQGLAFTDRWTGPSNIFNDVQYSGQALMNTLIKSNGLEEGYATTEAWLREFPVISTIWEDTVNNGNRFMVRNNTVTDNVCVDAPNGIKQQHIDWGTFERNLELGTDGYSIFVDPDNHDFRIKAEAVKKYNLSEKLINENNFSMDEIGPQRQMEVANESFKLLYPYNNMSIDFDEVTLAWEAPKFADEYTVQIATDSQFTNIVYDKESFYNCVEIGALEKDKTYYWRVTAKNLSKQIGNEWSSTVKSFKTSGIVSVSDGGYFTDGNKTNVEGVISNTTSADIKNAQVFVAFYDADSKLINVFMQRANIGGGKEFTLSASYENVPAFSEVKVFMMDEKMVPYMKAAVLCKKD